MKYDDERPMYIGFIMAGDGEVDQCIGPFETHELAQEAIDKINADHYGADGDRAYVVSPQSMDAALQEITEAEAEDAAYNASQSPYPVVRKMGM